MRLFLALCLAVGLGGCNMVLSEKPLFSPTDETGPRLRDGLWLTIEDNCPVDFDQPTYRWPDCAEWGVLRNGVLQRRAELPSEDAPVGWSEPWGQTSLVLVDGAPMLLQAGEEQEEAFFDERPERGTQPLELFSYHGLEPTALDEQSRIVAAQVWTAQCGPRARKANGRLENETRQLLPGLKKRKPNCSADTREAVINAAGASRAWTPKPATIRWVRDGRR